MLDLTPVYDDEPLSVSQLRVFPSADGPGIQNRIIEVVRETLYPQFGLSLWSLSYKCAGSLRMHLAQERHLPPSELSLVREILESEIRQWRIRDIYNWVRLRFGPEPSLRWVHTGEFQCLT